MTKKSETLEELETEFRIIDACITAPSDDWYDPGLWERYEEIRQKIIKLKLCKPKQSKK